MKVKLWTLKQKPQIKELLSNKLIPLEAANEALKVLSILDKYYGENRDVDNDDGGYLMLYMEPLEEGRGISKNELDKYHVPAEDMEAEDILCSIDGIAWKSVLYLTTNDYGITLIYPCKGEGE